MVVAGTRLGAWEVIKETGCYISYRSTDTGDTRVFEGLGEGV